MAFFVIAIAEDVDDWQIEEAMEAGPDHVRCASSYTELMERAGFPVPQVVDVSDAYRHTLRAWIRAWELERADILGLVGQTEFAERQARRWRALAAIRNGLLRRYLVWASRP